MRAVEMVVGTVLCVTVIAEGAYLFKTRRQVETLSSELRELRVSQDERPLTSGPSASDFGAPAWGRTASNRGGDEKLPPPRFVGSAAAPAAAPSGPVALPPALDTPEARDQLRSFIAAELQHERDQQRDRQRVQREEFERQRFDEMAKSLGLSGEENKKFSEILASSQTTRNELREKMQNGQIQRADMGREMQGHREKTETQLRSLLGDDRMKKYDELQQQQRGPGGGGGGGGGFGRRGGAPAGPGAQPGSGAPGQ